MNLILEVKLPTFTLILIQCILIFLFEVKIISNMTTRELHINLPRSIQPSADKLFDRFPVLRRESQKTAMHTSNEESKQGVLLKVSSWIHLLKI